jgi:hypothetical protein
MHNIRVVLYQSAKGFFASSSGYKSNLTVLRHLASQGHTVQQAVYAYEYEIQNHSIEQRVKDRKIAFQRSHLPTSTGKNGVREIKIARFTMADDVQVVALDAEDVDILSPKDWIRSLTRPFVEVCKMKTDWPLDKSPF